MYKGKKIISVAPAYNEEKRIINVVNRLVSSPVDIDTVLVVDDGSTDKTREVAEQAGAKVIPLPAHSGIGKSIRTGIDYAIDNKFDIIVILAGNNKDNPDEIPRLLDPIIEEEYDYVQGSRYLPGGGYGNMPLHRKFATKLYPILLRLTTGFPATDGTNGFKAYKTSIFSDSRLKYKEKWLDGTEFEFYLHIKVIKLGYKMKEVPVTKIYPKTKNYKEYTKVKPFRDWWRIIKPMVLLALKLRD